MEEILRWLCCKSEAEDFGRGIKMHESTMVLALTIDGPQFSSRLCPSKLIHYPIPSLDYRLVNIESYFLSRNEQEVRKAFGHQHGSLYSPRTFDLEIYVAAETEYIMRSTLLCLKNQLLEEETMERLGKGVDGMYAHSGSFDLLLCLYDLKLDFMVLVRSLPKATSS